MSDEFEMIFNTIEAASSIEELIPMEAAILLSSLDKAEKLTLTLLIRMQMQNIHINALETLVYDAYEQLGVDRKIRSNTFDKKLEKEVKEGKVYSITDLKKREKSNEPEV